MSCTNCFNGCVETVSDQCVVYTGTDVPSLGIHTNDSLLVVEQSLITFLISTLNGSGITIDLSSIDVCATVQNYLPSEGEIVLTDILKALIEASCDIQEQVNNIAATLATLNADYTIGCLTGVTTSSDTHDIVQATITKLCSVDSSVSTIVDQLSLFVTRSEFCTLLAQCTSDTPTTTVLASDKMLPYAVVPYYGPTNGYPTVNDTFNNTGAGTGYWARVFMCNGQNNTPDLRGRVPVGATNTPSTNPFPAQTNPGANGNPTYSYGLTPGANTVRLELPQIPAHNHPNSSAKASTTIPPHNHTPLNGGDFAIWANNEAESGSGSGGYEVEKDKHPSTTNTVNLTATTTITSVTITSQGQDAFHPNVQPGLALYYIQYRPA
jgi:microcystin-dependent protein